MNKLLLLIFGVSGSCLEAGITFVCEWQTSEPNYTVRIFVDDVAMVATRSDSDQGYRVFQINEHGVWLVFLEGRSKVATVQTIGRSAVGGPWTDNWLWNSGESNPTNGGYCIEEVANE